MAERKQCSIVETTLSLLYHASVPLEFWYHAFATTVFLINRLPSSSINYVTLFQKLFRCACYPSLKSYNTHKLEPKTDQHVFMGYTLQYKEYLCYNIQTKKMIVSRHVLFHENVFPFAQSKLSLNISASSTNSESGHLHSHSHCPNLAILISLFQTS